MLSSDAGSKPYISVNDVERAIGRIDANGVHEIEANLVSSVECLRAVYIATMLRPGRDRRV
jgi:hypothetical protein